MKVGEENNEKAEIEAINEENHFHHLYDLDSSIESDNESDNDISWGLLSGAGTGLTTLPPQFAVNINTSAISEEGKNLIKEKAKQSDTYCEIIIIGAKNVGKATLLEKYKKKKLKILLQIRITIKKN